MCYLLGTVLTLQVHFVFGIPLECGCYALVQYCVLWLPLTGEFIYRMPESRCFVDNRPLVVNEVTTSHCVPAQALRVNILQIVMNGSGEVEKHQ